MLKKIYLFIIPCCLIISKADACNRHGHMKFHNNTSLHLNVQVRRVWNKEIHCHTKPKKKWSKKQMKMCSKNIVYSYRDIAIAPKGRVGGICWEDNGLSLVDFTVTYKNGGKMQKGPVGKTHGYWHNLLNTTVFAHFRHGGNQSFVRSTGCTGNKLFDICAVKFYPVSQK